MIGLEIYVIKTTIKTVTHKSMLDFVVYDINRYLQLLTLIILQLRDNLQGVMCDCER